MSDEEETPTVLTCVRCLKDETVDDFGGYHPWHGLPAGWVVSGGRDHDEPEIYACSRECAESFDRGLDAWQEYERAGGDWPRARWRHEMASAKMVANHGTEWVSLLSKTHAERIAEREKPEYWKDAPERPKSDALVQVIVRNKSIYENDVRFCEDCLVEWIGHHACPKRGPTVATSMSPSVGLEVYTVPILESRYAFMVAKEA